MPSSSTNVFARLSVDVERLCLPAGAVERTHQRAAQPLAEWVGGHECLELRDERSVPAERELRLDP